MSYTLSLVGNAVLIESSESSIPDLDFPLQSTVVLYDNESDEVQFIHVSGRKRAFSVLEIANDDLDTIELLKAQVETWRAAATAGAGGGGGGAITSVDLGVKADAAASSDTGTFSLIALFKRMLQKLQFQTDLWVAGLVVYGKMRGPISDSFARPADTIAYAAGDAIQNATSGPTTRQFADLFPGGGGSGYLSIAAVVRNTAVTPRLRVHLFATDPVTKAVDNAAFSIATGDEGAYLGYIDLDAMSRGAACSANRKEIVCGGTNLFYQIQTLDAFTPASGTNYLLKATLDSNV